MVFGSRWRLTPRSVHFDLWALGVTLYQLAVGKLPPSLHERFMSPQVHVEGVSDELSAFINKALSIRVEDRFASAADMLNAIDAIEGSVTGSREKSGTQHTDEVGQGDDNDQDEHKGEIQAEQTSSD